MLTEISAFFYLVTTLLLWSCTSQINETKDANSYISEIEQWRTERIEGLKKSDSWLSLAGLYFLKEGPNTFGAAPENGLVFPEKAPGKMGTIWLESGQLRLVVEDGVDMLLNDSLVSQSTLQVHSEQTLCMMQQGSLSWFVLQRDDRFLIRLKDAKNKAFEHFSSIDHFPVDQKWKVPARFIAQPKKLAVRNVLDMEIEQESAGVLSFEINGQSYELSVLDGGASEYFIIFADHTTGEETYGGGRYLYTPKADESGNTFLDFNQSYNPPCVFTPYATCLLPPPQNRLNLSIEAGEKTYGDH